MKLLIATRNPGKFKEFKTLLTPLGYTIISLNNLKTIPAAFQVKETGQTFKANAILKAKGYGKQAKLLTLADDSGLVIKALPHLLGVNSAKFAQGDYKKAQQKIIKLLKNVPPSNRQAYYQISLALFNPHTQTIHTFSAKTHGLITLKPQGQHGFGYDPIFFSPVLNKTFGQATQAEKNQLSHRAKALTKLTRFLQPIQNQKQAQ